MRHHWIATVLRAVPSVMAALCTVTAAQAQPFARDAFSIDVRQAEANQVLSRPDARQEVAASRLRAIHPTIHIAYDGRVGSPQAVYIRDAYLLAAEGAGGSEQSDRDKALLSQFLASNRDLFGFGAEIMEHLHLSQVFTNASDPSRTYGWTLRLHGYPVYQAAFSANFHNAHQLTAISSTVAPTIARLAESAGRLNADSLFGESVAEAAQAALEHLGITFDPSNIAAKERWRSGFDEMLDLKFDDSERIVTCGKVWLILNREEIRPCWSIVVPRSDSEPYFCLVDAEHYNLLVSCNTIHFAC